MRRISDAAKVAGMYTSNAVFMPPNQPMVKGRAAIEAMFEKEFQEGAREEIVGVSAAAPNYCTLAGIVNDRVTSKLSTTQTSDREE